MAGVTIDSIANAEPQGSHNFEVEFTALPSAVTTSAAVLTYRIKTATAGDSAFEETEVHYKRDRATFAGKVTTSKIVETTFWEDSYFSVFRIIKQWHDFIYPSGTKGVGSYKRDYAATMVIKIFDAANRLAQSTKYENVWPANRQSFNLDMQSSEPIELPVTWRYDYVGETQYSGISDHVQIPNG